jgi:hypothetical protein
LIDRAEELEKEDGNAEKLKELGFCEEKSCFTQKGRRGEQRGLNQFTQGYLRETWGRLRVL